MINNENELKILSGTSGYVFCGGKLQFCTYEKTEFFLKEERDSNDARTYLVNHVVLLPNGERLVLDKDNVIFGSVDGYESETPAACKVEQLKHDVMYQVYKRAGLNAIDRQARLNYWTFEYGEPVQHSDELEYFYYDYKESKWVNPNPPVGLLYGSREEALRFNTYTVKNEDGTEETRDGISKLLMLSEEQSELLAQFIDAAKKLNDSGVILLMDEEEDCQAINTNNVEDVTLDYYDKNRNNDWEVADRFHNVFSFHIPLQYWCSDNWVIAKRKANNDRQKQD